MTPVAVIGAGLAGCEAAWALANAGIRESTLIPFVEVIPSGAVELIKKQQEGFAYIKP